MGNISFFTNVLALQFPDPHPHMSISMLRVWMRVAKWPRNCADPKINNGVFVHSGCYNKIPESGELINNMSFPTVLAPAKSGIMALADSVFGEGFLVYRRLFPAGLPRVGRARYH